MGLSRTVSEIDGNYSLKSQKKISTPLYFVSPLKGFSLELGIDNVGQKLESWGYWTEKEVWWYLQLSGYNTPTWRTDRQMDRQTYGHWWQQRPRLRIALHDIKIPVKHTSCAEPKSPGKHLTFWTLYGSWATRVRGFLPANFQLATPFIVDLALCMGQTDRWQPSMLNASALWEWGHKKNNDALHTAYFC